MDDDEAPSKGPSRRERKAAEAEANAVCHICGVKGHYARNCPTVEKAKSDE